ncbi:ABC-2 family transporter protein [Candidatus Dojkabacteria bacterium]|uniref:ABC-2 family transporter protein n=1 Tax=Candidatus Dojkabacteria bacterium TaxID=2099670 RepID=A0A955I6A1_9BACT|nr:ABC-2 family transporter protein [Candidatus Dojkabacteria bacterium]MCB9790975.1 ABC-2 family transporter protein [Candidatus Nomurabacteria bacterium]
MEINNSIKHFFKVATVEYKLSLASEFVYRWQVLMWVVSDAIQPVIFGTLWVSVSKSGFSEVPTNYIISYYFLVVIVSRLTQDWSIQFVSNSIIDGDFAKYLVRPFNYLAEMFGISLAIRTLRIILMIPLILVAFIYLGNRISYDLNTLNVCLFIGSAILGFVINFFLGNIFALVAFFIKQVVGLRALYVNLVSILSGEYIPLKFLSHGMLFIFQLLPFRYVLSFPIEILSGDLNLSSIRDGYLIGALWLAVLFFVYKAMFRYSIKKYESEGI